MSIDLFGNKIKIIEGEPIKVNIYADESMNRKDENNCNWHYICIIVERLDNPILQDIIDERFCGNFNQDSQYYSKNNKTIHWTDISSADEKNICKRWFEYILSPDKSGKKFYSYILGLNDSCLQIENFDQNDDFNSKYNRFFRSVILYALKTFFGNKKIIVENIYHEKGQQEHNKYFPWHCIYKIKEQNENIIFKCNQITFLSKDHEINEYSNLIQLCDCVLGVTTSIIHSIQKSNKSKYKEELIELYLPLLERLINNPQNKKSRYNYYNRIIVRFFPKENKNISILKKYRNQFYTQRTLKYVEDKIKEKQLSLFL